MNVSNTYGSYSGLDTTSLISQLVQIERQPAIALQNQVQADTTQQGLLSDLSTKLNAFSTSLDPLSTQASVQGRSVTIASGAPFTATATGAAPLGAYNIGVSQLAQSQRTYSNAFSSATNNGMFGQGTLTISIGGQSVNLNIDGTSSGTDTLTTVASRINSSGLALNAAVVYDGTNYRVVVNGNNSGSANAITFTDNGTGLGLNVGANTVVHAQNAQATIDGLAVTSANNTITGSIPGVTLNLSGTAPGTYSLSIANDPSRLQSSLQAMVTAYNGVMAAVNQQMPQPGSATTLGANTLVGDPTVRGLQRALQSIPTVRGGPNGNTYTTLAEIGVSTDQNGVMSVDTSKLQTALSTDSTAVTNLLVGTNGTNGLVTQLKSIVTSYTDPVSGLLTMDTQSLSNQIRTLNTNIDQMNSRTSDYQTSLQQEFTYMEQIMSSFASQTSALQQLSLSSLYIPGSSQHN